ncbi:hypothetical protein B0J13DRAFT_518605 [Dactylonectria estremocensis]|uniref:CFEM domain-containing protein n=1 Tax=Dactylonectria estremocensis TaxID=1079267 RepID=A0A9P9FJE3_9HYPO|nr:hypothetical protein B0J13DRAFT_518605 [Dactylonectria estremocensis]
MRTSVFVLATVAAGLAGAEIKKEDYFPECSIDCLNDGTEQATDCSTTDAVCWCVQSNYEAIYNQAVNCVLTECGADEAIDSVLPAAIEFCSAASSSASAVGSSETDKVVPSSSAITTADQTSAADQTSTSAVDQNSISTTDQASTSASATATEVSTSDSGITSGLESTSITESSSSAPSNTESGAAASTTASTDAAAVMNPKGILGMVVLGVVAAM